MVFLMSTKIIDDDWLQLVIDKSIWHLIVLKFVGKIKFSSSRILLNFIKERLFKANQYVSQVTLKQPEMKFWISNVDQDLLKFMA